MNPTDRAGDDTTDGRGTGETGNDSADSSTTHDIAGGDDVGTGCNGGPGSRTPLLRPFPGPPPLVAAAFTDLADIAALTDLAARGNTNAANQLAQYGDLDTTPRPWDPATCTATLRAQLWDWLDHVVEWVNHQHVWNPDRAIPGCWPHHPHLTREIAVLAALRYDAARALTPGPLEEWHRWALPTFTDRMRTQLGRACPPGQHTPWPAHSRHHDHHQQATARAAAFAADALGVASDASSESQ